MANGLFILNIFNTAAAIIANLLFMQPYFELVITKRNRKYL